MTKFEFDIIFAIPDGEHDALDLSNAVFEAGFEEAVVGTGTSGLLAVALEMEGEDAESVIVSAAREILQQLPKGSALREVRPDLVSLADVAKKLDVKRQALQKRREMPPPAVAGYYRITEVAQAIVTIVTTGRRKARFDMHEAEAWLNAGVGAQTLNARIALGEVDPESMEFRANDQKDIPSAYQIQAGA
ncbi:hypothetical protein [Ruegeria lacuscaerulensis]|uniref:hypothetical protein n=1 Tax=Ruegeria lacuscaerulensis TaxID=55218 RepID=UPI00147E2901|nr:hypothetical protein [Ruegeria lacuscaerulensis]